MKTKKLRRNKLVRFKQVKDSGESHNYENVKYIRPKGWVNAVDYMGNDMHIKY